MKKAFSLPRPSSARLLPSQNQKSKIRNRPPGSPRKGDRGFTGLACGARIPKDHPCCDALGDIDELQAALGVCRAFVGDGKIRAALLDVSKDLFAVGAQVAGSKHVPLTADRVADLDRAIREIGGKLPPLRGWIVRGGTKGAAFLHLACTVCRRAERRVVALCRRRRAAPGLVRYLNRLSELLFVMARAENGF